MMAGREDLLAEARDLAVKAGGWLAILRFQCRPGAPMFLAGISTYHDMLDPDAADAARCAACACLLPAVDRQVGIETWRAGEALARIPGGDRPGPEWRTTERGAALEAIAELLRRPLVSTAQRGYPPPAEAVDRQEWRRPG